MTHVSVVPCLAHDHNCTCPSPLRTTLISNSFPLSLCFRPLFIILLVNIPAAHQFLISRALPFPRNSRKTYIISSWVPKWPTARGCTISCSCRMVTHAATLFCYPVTALTQPLADVTACSLRANWTWSSKVRFHPITGREGLLGGVEV
jgi:hypothetical protein